MTTATLRGYQSDAVDQIVTGLRQCDRGQLRAACGTGKTLVALRAAERLTPGTALVVVLAPSIGLVAQTLDAWARDADLPFAESAVCSDETVRGYESGDNVSTDPGIIASWLRRPGRKVIAGTYASAPALAEAVRASGRPADLLVCDEAHRLAGAADKVAAGVVLDAAAFPARHRLFLTATPRLCFSDSTPGLSMDDAGLFGPVLYDYPFARAITDGWLDDYRVAVIGVTDAEIRRLLADGDLDYVDGHSGVSLPMLAAQVALARAARDYGVRRVLTFHSRVAAAAEFARTLNGTIQHLPGPDHPGGPASAFHVHGGMPSVQRELVFGHLRQPPGGGWTVVSNARCLTEGIDIPAIDTVLFASPRHSVTDIAQAVGRALRRHHDGPGVATIIIPVIVPADGDLGDLEYGAYRTVWRVVEAMRGHDEALATGLDFARTHWAQDGDSSRASDDLPPKVTVTIPGDVGGKMAAALSLNLIRHVTSPWWDGYGHAAAYHAEHGNLNVPNTYACDGGFRLGHWIGHARQDRRNGILPPDRAEALEKLGMIWDAFDAQWETFYGAARDYRAEHGHLLVQQTHITPDGLRLGQWIKAQRQWRQKMPPERRDRLTGIGMAWKAPKGPRPAGGIGGGLERWSIGLEHAAAYKQEHGHLDVPLRYVAPDGFRLGSWITRRRGLQANGGLEPELVRELEALGIQWSVRVSWPRGIGAATEYHAKHGHLNVPSGYVSPDGFELGAWIERLRKPTRGRGIKLNAARGEELNALGMRWEP